MGVTVLCAIAYPVSCLFLYQLFHRAPYLRCYPFSLASRPSLLETLKKDLYTR